MCVVAPTEPVMTSLMRRQLGRDPYEMRGKLCKYLGKEHSWPEGSGNAKALI